MSGMPLFDALLLLISVVVLAATPWRRLHPFLGIVAVATAFGLAAGFSVAFVSKAFGSGFAQAIASPGLVIVAAGFVSGLAEATGASGWLAAQAGRARFLGSGWLAALVGLIAGPAATPSTAFALLTPLLRATGGEAMPAEKRDARPVTLALAISASHGLLLFSPVPIAAASILDAAWSRVILFGLPLAVLSIVIGALWARWLSLTGAVPPLTTPAPPAVMGKPSVWSAAVLMVATIVPLALLMVRSLGDIPSEPLGGGMAREAVIGVGRPLVLLVAGIGIMVIGNLRRSERLLTDAAWTARILGNVAGLLLAVGAAGGLQRLCQETGMAELLGERLTSWHMGGSAAVPLAFLIAATVKSLQGSSLVAAITAAGIVQPLLIALGLGGDNAKALAALAVGAGAMTLSHINDDFFWLVTVGTGSRPLRALGALTAGTLVQGIATIAVLLMLALLVVGNS